MDAADDFVGGRNVRAAWKRIVGCILAVWPVLEWFLGRLENIEYVKNHLRDAAELAARFNQLPSWVGPAAGLSGLAILLWDWLSRRADRGSKTLVAQPVIDRQSEATQTAIAKTPEFMGAQAAYQHLRHDSQWALDQKPKARGSFSVQSLPAQLAIDEFVKAAECCEIVTQGVKAPNTLHENIPSTYWRNATLDKGQILHKLPRIRSVADLNRGPAIAPVYEDIIVPVEDVFNKWPLADKEKQMSNDPIVNNQGIITFNQSGGSNTVVNEAPKPTLLDLQQPDHIENNADGTVTISHLVEVISPYPASELKVVARADGILEVRLVPQSIGGHIAGHTGVRPGYAFTTLKHPIGKIAIVLRLPKLSKVEIEHELR
jgi:hypothetical protein